MSSCVNNRGAVPGKPSFTLNNRNYYTSLKYIADRSLYVQPLDLGVNCEWTINVGDAVAVEADTTEDGSVDGSDYEPLFIKPWWAAQIISMYKRECDDAIEMEVRWYNTSKDCGIEEDEEDLLKQLYETNTTDKLSVSLILGPVNIFTSIDEYAERDDENEGKLPIKNFVCNKFWNGAKINKKIVDFTHKGSFSRCIKCSSSKEYKAWILEEPK